MCEIVVKIFELLQHIQIAMRCGSGIHVLVGNEQSVTHLLHIYFAPHGREFHTFSTLPLFISHPHAGENYS